MPLVTLPGSVESFHAPPFPYLPFYLVEEILCRLPVKSLFQLRCVCKSWNSLISDPKFAKKHLRFSTTRHLHFVSHSNVLHKNILTSYPPHPDFTTLTHLEYPYNCKRTYFPRIVGSCNGILCCVDEHFVLLWNPSIRKFKKLPPFAYANYLHYNLNFRYGFGYDSFTDNYKVVACWSRYDDKVGYVMVHTLGTNFWKNIEFPFDSIMLSQSGKFVSGTVNWLASPLKPWRSLFFIVSLDLGNESYQKVLLPDYGKVITCKLSLGVLRDCLCFISDYDVWVMKEYGNKDSWTKLFTVSYLGDPGKSNFLTQAVYNFEDDQVLLETCVDWSKKFIVYDPRIGTFKFIKFQDKSVYDSTNGGLEVCVESLISPCS